MLSDSPEKLLRITDMLGCHYRYLLLAVMMDPWDNWCMLFTGQMPFLSLSYQHHNADRKVRAYKHSQNAHSNGKSQQMSRVLSCDDHISSENRHKGLASLPSFLQLLDQESLCCSGWFSVISISSFEFHSLLCHCWLVDSKGICHVQTCYRCSKTFCFG